jgi:hypothetical protein
MINNQKRKRNRVHQTPFFKSISPTKLERANSYQRLTIDKYGCLRLHWIDQNSSIKLNRNNPAEAQRNRRAVGIETKQNLFCAKEVLSFYY